MCINGTHIPTFFVRVHGVFTCNTTTDFDQFICRKLMSKLMKETFMYVFLTCIAAPCRAGDVRLVQGLTEREGRVELCKEVQYFPTDAGIWGTICDNQWSSAHTEVLCRSIGFAPDGKIWCCTGNLSVCCPCQH